MGWLRHAVVLQEEEEANAGAHVTLLPPPPSARLCDVCFVAEAPSRLRMYVLKSRERRVKINAG